MIALVHSVDRVIPSREFFVRQAILNAIEENYPYGLRHYGAAEVMRRRIEVPLDDYFVEDIHRKFRELLDIYGVPVASDLEFVGTAGCLL